MMMPWLKKERNSIAENQINIYKLRGDIKMIEDRIEDLIGLLIHAGILKYTEFDMTRPMPKAQFVPLRLSPTEHLKAFLSSELFKGFAKEALEAKAKDEYKAKLKEIKEIK